MRAIAVTPATKEVSIINRREPEISSPFDVKLRMLEAGVCGTDKRFAPLNMARRRPARNS